LIKDSLVFFEVLVSNAKTKQMYRKIKKAYEDFATLDALLGAKYSKLIREGILKKE